jgi:uncharacterized phage protein gp47/JayE
MRVLADANGALAHQNLLYLDWQAKQYLPTTAESEWLDKHGDIWVGGRKPATFATGSVAFTGINGTVVPAATRMVAGNGIEYETISAITLGTTQIEANVIALDAGPDGNQVYGTVLDVLTPLPGIDPNPTVLEISGGVGIEGDESLRDRILERIRKPPQGGAVHDYVAWAREVPGVTRAWAVSESIGTTSVRFMMDDDRPPYGIPAPGDINLVAAHIDPLRPVAVLGMYVMAPIPLPLTVAVRQLSRDSGQTRAAIEAQIQNRLRRRSAPGQTVYRSWIAEAVAAATGEDHHELDFVTTHMPSKGHIGVLGTLVFR